MAPRFLIFAVPFVPVVVALIPPTPSAQYVQGPVVELDAPQNEPGGILLRNAKARSVEIELRTGLEADCSVGRLLATKAILPGRTWAIHSSQPLCFRQTGTAGPGEPARTWQRKFPENRRVEEVEL